MDQLVRVTDICDLTPKIKAFTLARLDKKPLLPFHPGAHLTLQLKDAATGFSATRAYSLISDSDRLETYQFAVSLDEDGRGGSAFLHGQVRRGRAFTIGTPENSFGIQSDAQHHVLIAGGIGITPILSMVRALHKSGASSELHYIGKHEAEMAFLPELKLMCAEALSVYCTQSAGRPDLRMIVERAYNASRNPHVYVCGPTTLIDDVLASSKQLGIPDPNLHCESFSGSVDLSNTSFIVHLAKKDIDLEISPNDSILDAILRAGVDVPFDCKHGTCGACTSIVLEGEPLHRDKVYSQPENATADYIRICVSRCRTDRLVLDI